MENIYDYDKKVIFPKDDIIEIFLTKNDIEKIKKFFESLNLDSFSKTFVELCNEKRWDEEEKIHNFV